MQALTPQQVMMRHLQLLLQNERVLETELRRIARGLATTREQIARERLALGEYAETPGSSPGQRAA